MTIAIELSEVKSQSPLQKIRLLHYSHRLMIKFGWHTRAYATILGVMALAGLSLLILFSNSLLQKAWAPFLGILAKKVTP